MAPAVSVILNCYNHEPYVAEAIESVLGQTFGDFELILIDNGSTDGSRRVLRTYDDSRIRLVLHDDNAALTKRLNEGVALAKGEFVAVLYSDDFMLPHKLEHQLALFAGLPADYGVVYCPAIGLNQQTGERWQYPLYTISGGMMPEMLERHWEGHIDMSSPLTRRKCFEHHRWFEDLPLEGEAIFMRIALTYLFHFDPTPTIVLRDHGGNAGKAIKRNHEMAIELLDRFERLPGFREELRPIARRFRAGMYRQHCWALLRLDSGEADYVRPRFLKAVKLDPFQGLQPRMLAGIALSMLPKPLCRALNRLADRWIRHPGNRKLVESS